MTTLTEHANSTIVRGFYDALARGDLEALIGILGPDVTMLMPGDSPLAGLYSGRDAALGFLGSLQEAARGTYRVELRGLYANDTQVVAVHHGTGERDGLILDADAALVFGVADGVVTSITVHQADQSHWDAFFGA